MSGGFNPTASGEHNWVVGTLLEGQLRHAGKYSCGHSRDS